MAIPPPLPHATLQGKDLQDLRHAKALLENPGFAVRLANLVGTPLEKGFKLLPQGWTDIVHKAARAALTRDGFRWATIPLDAKAMADKVAAFRQGLRVEDIVQSASVPRTMFDLGLAYELYGALLRPVDDLIKGKRQLLIVPSGALTSLPLHVLVTEKPAAAPSPVAAITAETMAPYRNAAWLIRRQAITVLPSVE